MLFSYHHAYLLDKFGIQYFGLLNGISSFFAAILGLVGYPLQLLAVQIGNYSITFIPIGVVVLLVGLFPFFLGKKEQAEAMDDAKEEDEEPQKGKSNMDTTNPDSTGKDSPSPESTSNDIEKEGDGSPSNDDKESIDK